MKFKDLDKIYVVMNSHGVPGAAVETTNEQMQKTVKQIRQHMKRDGISKDELRHIHSVLSKELLKMFPDIIRKGSAIDSSGEFYDRQTFDNDLVLCAIYDHIANDKPIQIQTDIGPGSADQVH